MHIINILFIVSDQTEIQNSLYMYIIIVERMITKHWQFDGALVSHV